MKTYGTAVQCNRKTLYQMFILFASGLKVCPQLKSPLFSHLMNGHLLMLDQLSVRYRFNSSTSRRLLIEPLWHC